MSGFFFCFVRRPTCGPLPSSFVEGPLHLPWCVCCVAMLASAHSSIREALPQTVEDGWL